MRIETVYVCEKCGESYYDQYECQECEKNHILPLALDLNHLKYQSPGNSGHFKYPMRIRVKMENGDYVYYFYERNYNAEKSSGTATKTYSEDSVIP